MRWLLSTVLILIATPVFAQENEAEKLFRAMEKKIKEAKSLKMVWDTEIELGPGKSMKLKGSLHLAEGNKFRIEAGGDIGLSALRVSEGKQVAHRAGNGPVITKPVHTSFGSGFVGYLLPHGASAAYFGMFVIEEKKLEFDVNKELSIGAFNLGVKEKVGERDSQIFEFDVTNKKEARITSHVRIWIDPSTLTPLKRESQDPANPINHQMETYTEFIINPQLDPKLFELPK